MGFSGIIDRCGVCRDTSLLRSAEYRIFDAGLISISILNKEGLQEQKLDHMMGVLYRVGPLHLVRHRSRGSIAWTVSECWKLSLGCEAENCPGREKRVEAQRHVLRDE